MRSTQGKPYSYMERSRSKLSASRNGFRAMTTPITNTKHPKILPFPVKAMRQPAVTAHSAPSRQRARRDGMKGHRTLMRALQRIGEIAPGAPLSFLLVQVDDASGDDVRNVLACATTLITPIDRAAVYGAKQVGIVLQGASPRRASQVSIALEYRLNAPGALSAGARVRVSAASGTGENALVLPQAAVTSFSDCG
jgi:hypothetical protein